MTSNSFYFKKIKKEMREGRWVLMLASVVFLSLFIIVIMETQHYADAAALTGSIDDWVRTFTDNILLGMTSVTGAVICGAERFSYLMDKRKVDFFMSLPINRKERFLMSFLEGILFYLIPSLVFYTLSALAFVLICPSCMGIFPGLCLKLFRTFLLQLLIFMMTYLMMILAMMLTGKMVVATMGFLAFFFYPVAAVSIIPIYVEECFSSYLNFEKELIDRLLNLSPVTLFCRMTLESEKTDTAWIWALLITLILLAADYFLFLRRPMEKCGNSIIYRKLQPGIRILIVLLVSLYGGFIIEEMAPGWNVLWAAIGVIFTGTVAHGIMEMIFESDASAVFRYKLQLFLCLVISVTIAEFFVADPFDINSRIAEQGELSGISVYVSENYQRYCGEAEMGEGERSTLSSTDYTNENVIFSGDDMELVYRLIEMADTENKSGYIELDLGLHHKNGKLEERRIYIDPENGRDLLIELMNTAVYKENAYQSLMLDPSHYSELVFYNDLEQYAGSLRGEEIGQFLDIYRDEFKSIGVSEYLAHGTAGYCNIEIRNGDETWVYNDLYLGTDFTDTLAWLREHDIDLLAWKSDGTILRVSCFDAKAYMTDAWMSGDIYHAGYSGDIFYTADAAASSLSANQAEEYVSAAHAISCAQYDWLLTSTDCYQAYYTKVLAIEARSDSSSVYSVYYFLVP